MSTVPFIDLHHHILPTLARSSSLGWKAPLSSALVPPWNPQRTLDDMDAAGIRTTILSLATSAIFVADPAKQRRFVRECNEYAARIVETHPGRFGFFASVPLPDVDSTLREIEHAVGTLGADGIQLSTSHGVRWIGDASFTAVFNLLDHCSTVACIHPAGASCCVQLSSYQPHRTETVSEVSGAFASLSASGALGRFKNLRYLFSHGASTDGIVRAGCYADTADFPYKAGSDAMSAVTFGRRLDARPQHALARGNADRLLPRLATRSRISSAPLS